MNPNPSPNNLQQFKTNKNINMLWEVLLDELNINPQNTAIVTNIRSVFESNINPFLAKANPNSGLMNLNKIFLTQIVAAVNRLFPNINQQQPVKLINISDEIVSTEPYKVEDIHNARQSEFETQVNQRRNDFESLVMVKKPKELDFSDKAENSKIKEMEALIAETIAKRNFDIEQINTNMNTNQNTNTGQTTDEWLKPNNTSLRTEKQEQQQQIQNDTSQRKQKYVNVLEQEPFNQKKVSFNESNNMTMTIEEYTEPDFQDTISIPTNIFNKLKKVQDPIKPPDPIKNPDPNIQAQINDMNKKIDTLFTMMTELSSSINQLAVFKQDN
jgi:hypothetical protein